MYLFLKLNLLVVDEIANGGLTSDAIERVAGSLAKAEFGAELGPVAVVVHEMSVPVSCVVVHPAGRAGGVTPSKFCVTTIGVPTTNVLTTFG
jgi:hypothetical protein